MAIGASRVSMLRSFVFASAIDCAARGVGLRAAGDTLWAWDGRGVPPMDWAYPLPLIRPHPKIPMTPKTRGWVAKNPEPQNLRL